MVTADYTIVILVSQKDIDNIKSGEVHKCIFRTVEDVDVKIRVYIEPEESEDTKGGNYEL